ncbi:MAG: phage tail sheath family protein [Acetivibrionales bacterium]|jgi:phage tail sheath protein FI
MRSKSIFIFIMTVVFAIGLLIIFVAGKGNQTNVASEAVSINSVKESGEISVDEQSHIDSVKTISPPDVYIEEIPYDRTIQGVDTAVAGFLGITERGPLEPQLITSFSQFEDIFGEYYDDSYLAYSVNGFFENKGEKLYVARVTSQDAKRAKRELTDGKRVLATVEAISPGIWGNRIAVKISPGQNSTEDDPTFKMEVKYYDNYIPSGAGAKGTRQIQPTARISEVFEDVSLSNLSRFSFNETVNSKSRLIKINVKSWVSRSVPINDRDISFLTKGNDGSRIQLSDYIGSSGQNGQPQKGLSALGDIDEITILYSPDAQEIPGLNQAMINQCEQLQDRIVIIDTPKGDNGYTQAPYYDSSFAAVYSPWLKTRDTKNNKNQLVPPGGFIAGTYVNSDREGGVHKCPASVSIQGAIGLERIISRNEQEEYLFKKINPIISTNSRGILAYGARTLSNSPEYKYISVRRYINFIRESIIEGLQWTKYEVWSPALENKIYTSLSDFLNNEWTNGALRGTGPREAYFISIYRIKKSGDSDELITIIEVGLALLRPAEFYIVKLSV